jgi:hypothetical protein
MFRVKFLLSLVLLSMLLSLSYGQSPELPAGAVQSKVKTACMECHDAGIIVQQRLGKAGWTKEVDKMMKWGALVAPGDRDAFIEYLSTSFPSDKDPYKAPHTPAQSNKKSTGSDTPGTER